MVSVFVLSVFSFSTAAKSYEPHVVSGAGSQIISDSQQTTMRTVAFSAVSLNKGRAAGVGLIDIRRSNGTNKSAIMTIEAVAVERNQAVLIGRILWSSELTEIGIPAFFGVEDNGQGRKQKTPDRMTTVLGFIADDAFTPDYTVEQLRDLAVAGALTPINFGQDLQLGFELPLIELTLGNVLVR